MPSPPRPAPKAAAKPKAAPTKGKVVPTKAPAKAKAKPAAKETGPRPGDSVKVTAGEFAGQKGKLLSIQGEKPYLFGVVKVGEQMKPVRLDDVVAAP